MTARSNKRWRPVGLGYMGPRCILSLDFHLILMNPKAVSANRRRNLLLCAQNLMRSRQRAWATPLSNETKAAKGILQYDFWDVTVTMKTDGKASAGNQDPWPAQLSDDCHCPNCNHCFHYWLL